MPQVIHLVDPDAHRLEAVRLALITIGGYDVRAHISADAMTSDAHHADWVLLHHTVSTASPGLNQLRYAEVGSGEHSDLLLLDMSRLPAFAEQVRLRICSTTGQA